MLVDVFEDKELKCKYCGADFIFTAGEQEFYREKGLINEPQRCKVCRDANRNRVSFSAVCTACGGKATLPFKPFEGRPIYCKECFIIKKTAEGHSYKSDDKVSTQIHPLYTEMNEVSIADKTSSSCEVKQEIIKYYTSGYATHIVMNKQEIFGTFLDKNSREDEILDKLSKFLYITKINRHAMDQSSSYPFALFGATEILKRFIKGKYEFLVVFSYFKNEDWQPKTLKVETQIRRKKEAADRALVNFYVLFSNARNMKYEIDRIKGSTSAAVIPFSFDEILNCNTTNELIDIFILRFSEYVFENNMLGETSAIDDDNLLFGDRGKIADSIIARCAKGINSGIFGLRRSGKTSVLNAVIRRLERDNTKYVKIESRTELEHLDSWKTALFDIACKIRIRTLALKKHDNEKRADFIKRLELNSTEEEYQKRASQLFVEDVKLYCKGIDTFVIAIDEIELITYNTASQNIWRDVSAYCGFWGALRDCGCALIICGVNSTINETNAINFNGKNGDNPMYARIINCSESSKSYLPSFTDEQTKIMINTLGGYSNISFSNVYTDINRAFGGQPYAIRQFCSFVFEHVKTHRKPNEVYEVSNATISNLIVDFNNSAEGNGLCTVILQHLTILNDEYQMLKKIALAPEKYNLIQNKDLLQIDHLEKYGLIEYDRTTYYITFKINSIKEYIIKTNNKNPMDMTNDERRRYVQDCVAKCEIYLKTYLRNHYTYLRKESDGRAMFIRSINAKIVSINRTCNPSPNVNSCSFNDFFDHKKFIIYFSSLRKIIINNWAILGQDFEKVQISKNNFNDYMIKLNAGRNDADHYDAENTELCPEEWEINNDTMNSFSFALNEIKKFFASHNLTITGL